jgi:hypothetical protein
VELEALVNNNVAGHRSGGAGSGRTAPVGDDVVLDKTLCDGTVNTVAEKQGCQRP